MVVSNGSFMNQVGAAAWAIEGHSSDHCLNSSGCTVGWIQDQSAYWSELFGLWGIAHLLLKQTVKYKLSTGGVTIACDGLAALKQGQQTVPPNPLGW